MVNMKKNKPFSLNARSRSIKYAFEGLIIFFKQEHNAWIHLAATILVIGLSIFFSVSTHSFSGSDSSVMPHPA